jgi:hypothetical protein
MPCRASGLVQWRPLTFSANIGLSAFRVEAHHVSRLLIDLASPLFGRAESFRHLFKHVRHANFARRVTLSQPSDIAENQKHPYPPRHPASTRGTLRPIVTKREAGCDGCVDRAGRAQSVHAAKSRGPDAPTLASSRQKMIC